jgi:SAM-dependent methyltransferase
VPRLKPLIKGIGSFAIRPLQKPHKPLETESAERSYSIFLRNIALLKSVGVTRVPKTVAELGPGSTPGAGFAALIAGADKYYALDFVDHSNLNTSVKVFDDLVSLFRKKAMIPASGQHSMIFPDLDSYEFPDCLSFEPSSALFEERVSKIREDILRGTGFFFEAAAPWMQSNIIKEASIDWLFSHSVLEHVDDLRGTFRAIARWLKPGAYTSHLIDFDCHGLAHEWNGHWAIKDGIWFAIRGKRPYLLNRNWCETYLQLAAENGLASILELRNKRYDGLIREQFEPRFRVMSDQDARTRMIYTIHQNIC